MGKKSEQGNVIEIIIIAVLAVAVIGLVVWRFIDANTATSNNTQAEQIGDTTQTTTNQTTIDTSIDQNKGYVVIDDWGVRFKSENNLTVKYYKQAVDGEEVYEFTTATVEALNGCSGKYDSGRIAGSLGTVSRTNSKLTTNETQSPPVALHGGQAINGYYYYYFRPQALCSISDSDGSVEQQQSSAIATFLSTIEAKR